MRAIVDVDTCAGCGTCVEICPEVFELQSGIAINIIGEGNDIPEEYEDTCQEAADSCPVEAIVIQD